MLCSASMLSQSGRQGGRRRSYCLRIITVVFVFSIAPYKVGRSGVKYNINQLRINDDKLCSTAQI